MKKIRTLILLLAILNIPLKGFTQDVSFFNADRFFSIGTQSNRTASITLSDVDQDGDLDALVANGRHWAEQNFLFYNDGKGGFKTALPIGGFMDASYSMKIADFNKDGYLDIIEGNMEERNYVYLGRENDEFIEIGLRDDLKDDTYNIEIGDLNNDGFPDIVESNSGTWNLDYRNQIK